MVETTASPKKRLLRLRGLVSGYIVLHTDIGRFDPVCYSSRRGFFCGVQERGNVLAKRLLDVLRRVTVQTPLPLTLCREFTGQSATLRRPLLTASRRKNTTHQRAGDSTHLPQREQGKIAGVSGRERTCSKPAVDRTQPPASNQCGRSWIASRLAENQEC